MHEMIPERAESQKGKQVQQVERNRGPGRWFGDLCVEVMLSWHVGDVKGAGAVFQAEAAVGL